MTKSWSLITYWFVCTLGSDGGKTGLLLTYSEWMPPQVQLTICLHLTHKTFPELLKLLSTPADSLTTVKVDLKTAKPLRREEWGWGGAETKVGRRKKAGRYSRKSTGSGSGAT